jgi:hypothetical protein
MWITKLRMHIAFSINNPSKGEGTTLKQELFADSPVQYSSLLGYTQASGKHDRGMIEIKDPKGEAEKGACGNPLIAGVYPCDDSNNVDDSNAVTLRDWIATYNMAIQILDTPAEMLKHRYPAELQKEYPTKIYESFGLNNSYRSQTTRDEESIWGLVCSKVNGVDVCTEKTASP